MTTEEEKKLGKTVLLEINKEVNFVRDFNIQGLIEKGLLERTLGEYPVLRWTEASKDLVWGEAQAMIRTTGGARCPL